MLHTGCLGGPRGETAPVLGHQHRFTHTKRYKARCPLVRVQLDGIERRRRCARPVRCHVEVDQRPDLPLLPGGERRRGRGKRGHALRGRGRLATCEGGAPRHVIRLLHQWFGTVVLGHGRVANHDVGDTAAAVTTAAHMGRIRCTNSQSFLQGSAAERSSSGGLLYEHTHSLLPHVRDCFLTLVHPMIHARTAAVSPRTRM